MILDKVLNGVLDQGNGCVILFDEDVEDVSFPRPCASQEASLTQTSPPDCLSYGHSDDRANWQGCRCIILQG